jgi:hypothetical protein
MGDRGVDDLYEHQRVPQIGDQIEIGCSGDAFKHKEGVIPPTSTHGDSHEKDACD